MSHSPFPAGVQGFGPLYQEGHLSIENSVDIAMKDLQNCQVGVQVAPDGRVWVCVDGVSYLRFKPKPGMQWETKTLDVEVPPRPSTEEEWAELPVADLDEYHRWQRANEAPTVYSEEEK